MGDNMLNISLYAKKVFHAIPCKYTCKKSCKRSSQKNGKNEENPVLKSMTG